jgi:hypothetical protein
MSNRSGVYSITGFLALGLLAGCNSHASSATEEDEHGAPPHKPAGFVEGVAAIHDRLAKFQTTDIPLDREARRQQAGELKDIIQWLPELAAETDMRKSDWDSVHAAAKRMAARWDEIAARLVDRPAEPGDAGVAALEQELPALDRLVQTLSQTTDAASGGR